MLTSDGLLFRRESGQAVAFMGRIFTLALFLLIRRLVIRTSERRHARWSSGNLSTLGHAGLWLLLLLTSSSALLLSLL